MTKVAILGAGQIGRAVYKIISDLSVVYKTHISNVEAIVVDSSEENIRKLDGGIHGIMNLSQADVKEISDMLIDRKVTHVINALPFFLNEKVAQAAVEAGCHYIDFTEDDIMADKVQEIYKNTELNCAVKCGLAPGFINYIGYDLVGKMDAPDTLMISVGALPRMVSFDKDHPELSYNLTWSVDGLVNEYIRPCRVREDGKEKEVDPLTGHTKVVLDGMEYEAAFTSGGIGSLVKDLTHVPNVHYMTLRYPGHYAFIRKVVKERKNDFESIRKYFEDKFPFTDDDVIVVYANAVGRKDNQLVRRSYFNKFYGVNGLSGIQATTAGSGVAMLELMLTGKVNGKITHSNVTLEDFSNTIAFQKYYKTSK
jgi:saccharopine dehydrogenase-like NADP-dependent oxidoreductase